MAQKGIPLLLKPESSKDVRLHQHSSPSVSQLFYIPVLIDFNLESAGMQYGMYRNFFNPEDMGSKSDTHLSRAV